MHRVFQIGDRVRDANPVNNRGAGVVVAVDRDERAPPEDSLFYTVRWDDGREDAVVYPVDLEQAPAPGAAPAASPE